MPPRPCLGPQVARSCLKAGAGSAHALAFDLSSPADVEALASAATGILSEHQGQQAQPAPCSGGTGADGASVGATDGTTVAQSHPASAFHVLVNNCGTAHAPQGQSPLAGR